MRGNLLLRLPNKNSLFRQRHPSLYFIVTVQAAIACRAETIALTKGAEDVVNICLENLKHTGHSRRIFLIKPNKTIFFIFGTSVEQPISMSIGEPPLLTFVDYKTTEPATKLDLFREFML